MLVYAVLTKSSKAGKIILIKDEQWCEGRSFLSAILLTDEEVRNESQLFTIKNQFVRTGGDWI